MFSGGSLVFGAGGGGALLVLFSALVSDIAMSSPLRRSFRRSSLSSCFLSRSSAFASLPPEVPEVSGQFFSCLFEFSAKFFYPIVILLFFVLFRRFSADFS